MARKDKQTEDEESGSSGSEFEDRQTASKQTKKTKQSDQRNEFSDRFYEEASRSSGRSTRKSTKQQALDDEEIIRERRKHEKEMKKKKKELQKEREELAERERELHRQRRKTSGGTSSISLQTQRDYENIDMDDTSGAGGYLEAENTEVVTVIQAPRRLPLRRANEPALSISDVPPRRSTNEPSTSISDAPPQRQRSDEPPRLSSGSPAGRSPETASLVNSGRSEGGSSQTSSRHSRPPLYEGNPSPRRPSSTPTPSIQPSTILDDDDLELSRNSDVEEEVQRRSTERKDRRKEAKEKEKERSRNADKGNENRHRKRKSRHGSESESNPESNSSSGSESEDEESSTRNKSRKKQRQSEKKKRTPPAVQEKPCISRVKSKKMAALIVVALRIIKALLISGTPYPSSSELDQLTADSWEYALKKLGYDRSIDSYATKILAQRPSQLRGNLITITRHLTQAHWALGNIGAEARSAISRRVGMLREGGRFLYQDISEKTFLFKNTLIQQVVKNAFFADKKSVGIQFSKYFNPISKETLALVLTAIDHVLSEHSSGILIKKQFSEHEAFGRYLGFLKIINEFQATAPEALRTVLQDIHDQCRDACGAGPVSATTSILSASELALAARFYEDH